MVSIPSNKDALLAEWKTAKAALDIAKATEAQLRTLVVEVFSQETDPMKSGVENVDVGWGYKLKIEHKLTYKLDNADDCAKLANVLATIETSMAGGNIIADRLVKWKPELSVSEYKLLSPVNKALIDGVLTITPASKSVELVPPKA